VNKTVARRLDFLKMEGLGFSLCEIVKVLSEKYRKSARCIYYDAETRGTWQPLFTQLFNLDTARLVVVNRYETIYRKAAFMFTAGKPGENVSALKVMLDVTKQLSDLIGLKPPEAVNPVTEEDLERAEALATQLMRVS